MKKKTVLEIEENVEGLLAYVLGWITGLIFLIIEKNKFVRFHALQSLIVFGFLNMVFLLLSPLIPFIKFFLLIISLIVWIVSMIEAYNHEWFKWPIAGSIAEKYA